MGIVAKQPALNLSVLGSFRASRVAGAESFPICIRSPKRQSLLAYLAMQPDGKENRGRIADLLWGDRTDAKARQNLRQSLLVLRKELASLKRPVLDVGRDFVRLDLDRVRTDAHEFAALSTSSVLEDLATAAALYRGTFLGDATEISTAFEDWLLPVRSRLQSIAETVLEALIRGRLLEGSGREAIVLLERLLAFDPLREDRMQWLLGLSVEYEGRGPALARARSLERALTRDYGVEPDPSTILLIDRIRSGGLEPPVVDAAAQVPPRRPLADLSSQDPPAAATPTGGVSDPTVDDRAAPACPRILILPPLSILGQGRALKLANAFFEDVTVGLSCTRSFAVIAPHTAGRIARDVGTAEAALEQAGAHYVVTTALKPTPNGLAMTFRMTEAATGSVISVSEVSWHPDRLTGVFHHLVADVVRTLVSAVERATLRLPTVSAPAGAYRAFLEGKRCLNSIELASIRRARRWFRDAATEAARYAAPFFGLARARLLEWFVVGMPEDAALGEALALTERGLAYDAENWRGLREKAVIRLWQRRHADCLALFEQASNYGPHDADVMADYADALAHCGDPEQALVVLERATAANPIVPDYYVWIEGSILFQTGRYDAALACMSPIAANPATSRLLVACAARAGRADDLRVHVRTLREVYPTFKADDLWRISPNKRREDTAHYVDALKSAGVA